MEINGNVIVFTFHRFVVDDFYAVYCVLLLCINSKRPCPFKFLSSSISQFFKTFEIIASKVGFKIQINSYTINCRIVNQYKNVTNDNILEFLWYNHMILRFCHKNSLIDCYSNYLHAYSYVQIINAPRQNQFNRLSPGIQSGQ